MDLATKALLAREYSKQAQLAAIEAAKLQRGLEKEQFEEERAKALSQVGSLQPEKKKHQAFSLDIKLNEKQQLAVEYARAGKSFVLTGAAGTGKTTACREIARAFLVSGDLGRHTFRLEDGTQTTSHGIAFCSYTRRATANIRRALHQDPNLEEELNVNVVTIHRLLEYYPEFFPDPKDPSKTTMRFIPRRTAQNPLDLKVLVLEESSMLGLDLYDKLFAALRPGVIIVFVGDINQLPPVFGKSIMNYALGQLPIVELTDVYRQALDSGIIQNAHRILKGTVPEVNKDTQLVTGKQQTHTGQERMARGLGGMFFKLWEAKEYDPEQDIILSPWNKQPCGTDNLNNWIAQFLGEQRKAMVYEVLAGRRKLYLAIGDRVMYEKQDGMITAVRHNMDYLGKPPNPAGTDLTRFGMRKMQEGAEHEDFEAMAHGYANINIDEVPDEEKKLQASHVVEITLDSGEKAYLRAVGDYAEQVFSLGYVLTVHKAQGCEWRKVYVVLHRDHTLGGFLTRELLYTAITRAREKLVLLCKPEVLAKAVKQQSIKGNTLQEKIASINSGAQNIGTYPVIKPLKEKVT
jgi:exodeoxyribonuclease V alpha subunit